MLRVGRVNCSESSLLFSFKKRVSDRPSIVTIEGVRKSHLGLDLVLQPINA